MKVFCTLLLLFTAVGAAAEKSGPLTGTIIGRDVRFNQLTVAHGDVPGIMGAMTMSYEVRGLRVGTLPKGGTKITATLHELNGKFWLTDVKPAMAMPMPMQTPMPGMHHHETSDPTADFLMRQASGTSMNPAAAPMHMSMSQYRGWTVMLHGQAYLNQVVQSGPRGGDKLFSTNWVMGMADKPLGGGHLMLRTMLSLEPLTVGHEYPELFQTGETLHGRPIVDAQHPHDFFMELAAEYAHPISDRAIGYIYAAPAGDPALGPVAYPHRASAAEIPQATLSHHVQDSTHIAASVFTIGVQNGMFGYAISGFHGAEPDENRWDIDTGRLDSWSARATFDPTPNWTAQVSTGHLRHPEALEPGNVQRTTASVAYSSGACNTSFIFGHNHRTEGRDASAWVAESVLKFGGANYVTARGEIVDKDELFPGSVDRIKALTAGYTRDLVTMYDITAALGGNVTIYSIPRAIRPSYGSSPHAFYVFARFRGGSGH